MDYITLGFGKFLYNLCINNKISKSKVYQRTVFF